MQDSLAGAMTCRVHSLTMTVLKTSLCWSNPSALSDGTPEPVCLYLEIRKVVEPNRMAG